MHLEHPTPPSKIKEARQKLGLNAVQFGRMLGYEGENIRVMIHRLETGERPLRAVQYRLLEAYLSGYRPSDWPK